MNDRKVPIQCNKLTICIPASELRNPNFKKELGTWVAK